MLPPSDEAVGVLGPLEPVELGPNGVEQITKIC